MGTKSQMAKWGNSLAIRIPKSVAADAGLREGDPVDVAAIKGRVIVKRARKVPTLHELVAKITPENIHKETDWGPPVGKEIID